MAKPINTMMGYVTLLPKENKLTEESNTKSTAKKSKKFVSKYRKDYDDFVASLKYKQLGLIDPDKCTESIPGIVRKRI